MLYDFKFNFNRVINLSTNNKLPLALLCSFIVRNNIPYCFSFLEILHLTQVRIQEVCT